MNFKTGMITALKYGFLALFIFILGLLVYSVKQFSN